MITFEVPGKPMAKARARTTRFGTFTPKATVNAEAFIRGLAADHFPVALDGPVSLRVVAVFQPAASWSRPKRARAMGSPHTQKPDFDNVQKLVSDALNGIAYRDDSQIAEATVVKTWGQHEKMIISVAPLRPGELPLEPEPPAKFTVHDYADVPFCGGKA